MSIPANRTLQIAVLIVTYGDRWSLLQQTLAGVRQEPLFSHIIIVNNASLYPLEEKLSEIEPFSAQLKLINLTDNLGSAGGIKTGMCEALNLNLDLLYILDDDNLIVPGTIGHLLNAYETTPNNANLPIAFFSYRDQSSPFLRDVAHGIDPKYIYNKKNNFAGFSLQHIVMTKYRKWVLSKKRLPEAIPMVQIPIAPWSGLLIPLGSIRLIGLPFEPYFLYADDTEYSFRITKAGGAIWMVTQSMVKDLEVSWGFQEKKNKFVHIPMLENTGFRVYYTVRNLIHFSQHNLVDNVVLFFLNGFIFTCYLFTIALLLGKLDAFKVYWRAVKDALQQKLGPRF